MVSHGGQQRREVRRRDSRVRTHPYRGQRPLINRAFAAAFFLAVLALLFVAACNENDEDDPIPPDTAGSGGDDDTADCTDADNDGWCAPQDCQDHNAQVNPGRTEDCLDGFDNDCNGFTDADDPLCASSDDDTADDDVSDDDTGA